MSKEKGGGDYDIYILSREAKFNEGNKLDEAVVVNYKQNFLSAYQMGIEDYPHIDNVNAMVGGIPHYLEQAREECQGKPGAYELIEKRSDPEAVAALDQLIDEFKADFPRIIRENDKEAVQKFIDRAEQLVK